MRAVTCASAAVAIGCLACAPMGEPKEPDPPPVSISEVQGEPPPVGRVPDDYEAGQAQTRPANAGRTMPAPRVGEQGSDVVARDFTLRPGETVELELAMDPNRRVRVAYVSTAPLEWRVLEAGAAEAYRRGFGNDETIELVAPAADTYAYEWTNPTDEPAQLTVSVNVQEGIAIRKFSREQTAIR